MAQSVGVLGEAAFLPLSPLVQRSSQTDVLRHALSGPPSIVFLEGEAGIGKSRLVDEVLAQLRAADPAVRIFRGHCHPQQNPFPLLPVVEALRAAEPQLRGRPLSAVVGALRPLLPELAPVLPPAPEAAVDSATGRHQVFRALVELLAAVAPGVLVLEDLHWADVGTVEFLHFLVTQPGPRPHLVLTYRRDDLPPDSALRSLASRIPAGTMHVRIELPALDDAGVAELVSGMLRTDVSPDFATFLHQRTAGVPFAVEEVLRLLSDRRDLVQLDGRWARHALTRLEVPMAIRDSIGERVSRLPADARAVVEAVAVLGQDARSGAVADVADLADPDRWRDALSVAVTSALIREADGGALEFRHDLAREAAYDAIGTERRRELHERALRTLLGASGASAARLAGHCRAAGDERWATYAEQAADESQVLGDDLAAYETLREILVHDGLAATDRRRIAAKLAGAALQTQAPDEGAQLVRTVLERDASTDGDADLQFLLALLLFKAGDINEAFAWLARCASVESDSATGARAMSMLAFPMIEDMSVEQHLDWLERAVASVERLSSPVDRAAIQGNAATIRVGLGLLDPATVRMRPEEGQPSAVVVQESRAQRNLAEMCCYIGQYDEARHFLAVATELDVRIGRERSLDAEATHIYLDFLAGEWSRLVERCEAAESSRHVPQAEVLVALARLQLAARSGRGPGRPDDLSALVDQALACGSIPVFFQASAALADALLDLDRTEHARDACERALAVLRRKGLWVWSAELIVATTRTLTTAAKPTAARRFIDEAEAGLAGRLAPAASAAVLTARGLTATSRAARRTSLAAAQAAWTALPRPYEAAACLELQAQTYGDSAAAAETGQAALEAYAALGATRDAARVARTLREAGVAVRARRPGRFGEELSDREQEVVQLVALGHTNRAIAEQLFLSPRTVEHHVERAMRKVGVQSRTELARAWQAPDR